ncbi:MAG: helix-turn-helix domain-containing protein [Ilumatobacteraceae bacterium]
MVELSGVSARQLQRRFARTVGYGPAFLSRIARLQRAARLAARRPDIGVAELAVQAGFIDQAHLAKHCRAIAHSTPREFVDGLARTSIAFSLRDLGVSRTGWPERSRLSPT